MDDSIIFWEFGEAHRQTAKNLTHTGSTHPAIWSPSTVLRSWWIYGNTFNGLTIEEQIKRLVGPPIWPVYPEELDHTEKVFAVCVMVL